MRTTPGVRTDPGYRLVEREPRFRGRFIGVSVDRFVLPGGHETVQEVIHLPSAVCVIPLLARAGGELEAVLVEQFRNSVQGFIHEYPAGMLEEGEDPRVAAERELEEETGYRAARWTPLATVFPLPGASNHRMHFFVAEELTAGEQKLEDAECLSVTRVAFESLLRAVVSPPSVSPAGDRLVVVDAKTHLGTLHAAVWKGITVR